MLDFGKFKLTASLPNALKSLIWTYAMDEQVKCSVKSCSEFVSCCNLNARVVRYVSGASGIMSTIDAFKIVFLFTFFANFFLTKICLKMFSKNFKSVLISWSWS